MKETKYHRKKKRRKWRGENENEAKEEEEKDVALRKATDRNAAPEQRARKRETSLHSNQVTSSDFS